MNYLDDIFYSTEIYGYLGPIGLLVLGYVIARKDRTMGIFYYVLLLVMAYSYFDANFVANSWKAFALIFGGAAVCLTGNSR